MKKPEDYLLEIRQELVSMNLGKRVVTMKEAKEQPYFKTYVKAFDTAQKEAYNQAIEDIQNDIQRFKKFEGEEGVLCISIDRINELKK
jgi:hypothetical protein